MNNIEKSIIAFNYFSLGLLVPIINLIILERGATLHTLPLLLALYSVTVLVFELPSGICADLFGRKIIFLISCIFQFLSILLLFLSTNVIWLAFVLILHGLGRAFSSGSIDALFIDQAIEKKGESALSNVTSAMALLQGCGLALGGIIGGFLASMSNTYNYNLILRMTLTVIVFVLCFLFVKDTKPMMEKEKKTSIMTNIKTGMNSLSVHPNLFLILSGIFLTGMFLSMIETYWQPAFKVISITSESTWLLGIISFMGFAAGSIGNVLIDKIMVKFKYRWWGILALSRWTFGCVIVVFALQQNSLGFMIGYSVVYLLLGISNVVENTIINKLISSQLRASFLSLSSLISQVGFLCASLFSSFVINILHFNGLWLFIGILILIHSVVILLYRREIIMKLSYEKPTAEDYISLRMRSGMGNKDLERSRTALENSLFCVSLYDEDKLIGFGRIVGDGGITYVVSDIMVDENYRRKGYADQIMKAINSYFEENTFEDSYICLIANQPADLLYSKYNFQYLPANKCGMLRKNEPRRISTYEGA